MCILLIVFGRVINFLVPLMFSRLVKVFEEGSSTSPWPYLFAYVGLRFLQSSGGIGALRDVRSTFGHLRSLRHLPAFFAADFVGTCHAVFRSRNVAIVFRSSSQFILCFPFAPQDGRGATNSGPRCGDQPYSSGKGTELVHSFVVRCSYIESEDYTVQHHSDIPGHWSGARILRHLFRLDTLRCHICGHDRLQ